MKHRPSRLPIAAAHRRVLRDQVDGMVNLYKRLFTSADNPLPDCLIIGAQRAGTSSLYRNILQHPGIQGATRKEVHFFDQHFGQGTNWYRSFFNAPGNGSARRLSIEATPYYLYHPAVPQRVKAVLPEGRFIALLRDPVERAYSEYLHARQRGYEPLGLAEALDAEAGRLRGEEERLLAEPGYASHAHRFQSYQSRGLYARQLARWLELFPRDRFLLLKAEDLYADTQAVAERVADFLGLANSSIVPTWRNSTPGKAPMPREIRERLRRYFEPANAELRAIAGSEFQWDDTAG
ncbi:sulfotransferase [Emcibacter sp. SYSU 3D8]|uniref:sulfotransferase family protein n=1 Tax=Emcibacter sp. SYSU 3D8 TaxID=3133969 RepID=UPI0031FE5D5A